MRDLLPPVRRFGAGAALAPHLLRQEGRRSAGRRRAARPSAPSAGRTGTRRARSWISRLVMPCSTNRLKPTGGVICAISTTSTMKMPNQSEVDAGLLDRRQDHAHRQHDHRDAVEEAAEDDVEQRQRDDQRERRQPERARSIRRGGAAGRCSPSPASGTRRRRGSARSCSRGASRPSALRGTSSSVSEPCTAEMTQRADDAERRGLGGGGDAGVDRAQHGDDQQHHRDQVPRRVQLLRERRALGRRRDQRRVAAAPRRRCSPRTAAPAGCPG